MQECIFKIATLFTGFVCFGWANAQQVQPRPQRPGGSAEGALAVTATVVSSTGVVIGPDGKMRIIVANAADTRDSASHSLEVQVEPPAPENEQKPEAMQPQKKPKHPGFPGLRATELP